ncbi:MAG: PD-(D/E)XK nuclease family protein, partial [Candidatus Aminicenantes bacterium]|nr:PD-(D/E)XK nuclease family protein [Candidatus Aminicenantes bacterium]
MAGYSYSSISSFDNCPKSFEFRYIKKIPEAFQSIEAFMGSTVHSVLEMIYRNRELGPGTDELELPGIFRKIWDSTYNEKIRIIKNENDINHYIDLGIRLLSGYYSNSFLNDLSKTISLEQKFEVQLNGKITLRGIIDRLSRTKEGILRVTDFKTGSASGPLENLQLPSYAVHVFETNNEEEIVKIILEKGALQLTQAQRKKLLKDKIDEIINFIHIHCINPQTNKPHPPARIESAIDEAGVNIDFVLPADKQAKDIIKQIQAIIPIRLESVVLAVKVTPDFTG